MNTNFVRIFKEGWRSLTILAAIRWMWVATTPGYMLYSAATRYTATVGFVKYTPVWPSTVHFKIKDIREFNLNENKYTMLL